MHHAGIEPHVHDIGGFVVLVQVDAQLGGCVQIKPRVDAVALHQLGHFRDQLMRARMQLAGHLVDEQRNRHPPSPLPRHAPIRARRNHAGDALLSPGGHPVDMRNRFERRLCAVPPAPC